MRHRHYFYYFLTAFGALVLIALMLGVAALYQSHRRTLIQTTTGNSFGQGTGIADWAAFTDGRDRARIIVISAGDLRRLAPGFQNIDFKGAYSVTWHEDTGDEVRIFGAPVAASEIPLLVVNTESRRDIRRHLTEAEAQQIYQHLRTVKTLEDMLQFADNQVAAAAQPSSSTISH